MTTYFVPFKIFYSEAKVPLPPLELENVMKLLIKYSLPKKQVKFLRLPSSLTSTLFPGG
jgi:hypothetical protein